MTPEQKQFYDKLGDALRGVTKNHKQNLDVVTVDCEDITVINHAAQKLHDLWPTLCDLDEVGKDINSVVYNITAPTGVQSFLLKATNARPTISKAVGGGDE